MPRVPAGVLEAMAKTPYTEAEILDASYPMAVSGVYFLIMSGEVVYVGQSINILTRIDRHRRECVKIFDAFTYIEAPSEALNELEAVYIKALVPRWNMSFGNKPLVLATGLAVLPDA
jgi:excinuclease UvrABC nuclease subunit